MQSFFFWPNFLSVKITGASLTWWMTSRGEGGTEYTGKERRWETLCETEDGEREPSGDVCRECNRRNSPASTHSRGEEKRWVPFSNLLAPEMMHCCRAWKHSSFPCIVQTHVNLFPKSSCAESSSVPLLPEAEQPRLRCSALTRGQEIFTTQISSWEECF